MAEERAQRGFAAILAADVVGYPARAYLEEVREQVQEATARKCIML